MIVTDLMHIEKQVLMDQSLKKAIDFLRQLDPRELHEGKIEIDGQRVFALLQQYETITVDTPKFEYHQKYIDVQHIVSGEEVIGWVPADQMTITEPYNADKDICFGTAPKGQMTPVHLRAGQLAILYPEDGHAPKLAVTKPSHVFKLVIKVAVS